jgi:hypothetical protein
MFSEMEFVKRIYHDQEKTSQLLVEIDIIPGNNTVSAKKDFRKLVRSTVCPPHRIAKTIPFRKVAKSYGFISFPGFQIKVGKDKFTIIK